MIICLRTMDGGVAESDTSTDNEFYLQESTFGESSGIGYIISIK